MAPDQPGNKADHEPQGDSQDHHGGLAFPKQAANDQAVQQVSQRPHDPQRDRQCHPERQTHILGIGQTDGDKGPQHHEIALREVHRLGRLVNQNKAKRDQGRKHTRSPAR